MKQLGPPKKFYVNLIQKEQLKITLLLKMRIIFVSAKVSVFQQGQINYHPTWSQRLYLALLLKKVIKNDQYSSIIMWTHKNSKGKYWVVSQQALFFNAFLARHDDDNDAHIEDKNWNIMGASWRIWLAHLSLTHFLCIGILWANNLWEQESTCIGR